MKKVPHDSMILKNFGETDYIDSYQIIKNTNDSIDDIITNIFKIPKWIDCLMKIRDLIVGIFKLKTGDIKNKNIATFYPIGSKAVLFTVHDRNENEIIMEKKDLHLNFRTSVLIDRKEVQTFIYLTTIVKYNNIWGQIYFFPVKPFHQLIIKSVLKRYNMSTLC